MTATFEEKSYEQYFNVELAERSSIFFPLGQVQEGKLGFDAGSFSRNRRFWRHLGFPHWFFPHFDGADLRELADEMEHYLGIALDHIPRMKSNLLFQYKRPEYIGEPTGKEWNNWNTPYYRYDIYKEQQDLLFHLSKKFGDRVLILYACPATHNVHELVDFYKDGQVILNSNFRKASELQGHDRNTYVKAGTYSIACSDPERFENFDLIKTIENFKRENNERSDNNRLFIINFRKLLLENLNETEYANSLRKLNEEIEYYINFPLLYSFLVLTNFKTLTGIQWLVTVEK